MPMGSQPGGYKLVSAGLLWPSPDFLVPPAPGLPLSFKGQFFGEPNSGRASSDQGYNPNLLRLKVRET